MKLGKKLQRIRDRSQEKEYEEGINSDSSGYSSLSDSEILLLSQNVNNKPNFLKGMSQYELHQILNLKGISGRITPSIDASSAQPTDRTVVSNMTAKKSTLSKVEIK